MEKPLTPEELNEGYKKADPFKFSPLDSTVKLPPSARKLKKSESVEDPESGSVFYKVIPKKEKPSLYSEPEVSRFVVLMSKGILHVSDIVEVKIEDEKIEEEKEIKNRHYFSKEMPLNLDLSTEKPARKAELSAEIFLLKWIFGDWDKTDSGKNVHIAHSGKFAHYDFDVAFTNFEYPKEIVKFDFKKHGNIPFDTDISRLKIGVNLNIRNVIREKLDLFEEELNDFKFFKAVIEKSGLDLNSERFELLPGKNLTEKEENLRQYFLERVKLLRNKIGVTTE